ncbi:hypothetical protein [Psychrobacter immobilis]|uniref:hypothetical protein n=1 Tax=Psychrobacter immobilis TaxID=498 RepID=UPI00191A9019|nr:hypothetical protein [Psychrobacter immobilis]
MSKDKSFYDQFNSIMTKNQGYYAQFNNCDNIRNNFEYLTVAETAILWCGIPRNELANELAQCVPKGDESSLSRSIVRHPYVQCVEPRCALLHQAFENGKLKMGRDGGNSDYKHGQKDKKESDLGISGIGHINHDRRTIKIADLKEFIVEYHADDMPKTLFSDIDIHKLKPITHDDYSALLAKNQVLEARLEEAKKVYIEQRENIQALKKNLQAQTAITENDIPQASVYQLINTMKSLLLDSEITESLFANTDNSNASKLPTQSMLVSYIADMNIKNLSERTISGIFAKTNKI